MTVLAAVIAGAIGTLLRAEVIERMGERRGVAAVNLAGCWLAGLLVGWAGGHGADSWALTVIGLGGIGGLTTFSTWIVDATDRPDHVQVADVVVTMLAGVLLAGFGWFLAALFT